MDREDSGADVEPTNQERLDVLRGHERGEALADLRGVLVHGLSYALADWSDLDWTTLEELAQEDLLKILASLDSLRGDSRFTTWGGGDDDSSFGANNAIDGRPNTGWSADGDGDDVWIEIGLAQIHDLPAIGFWTRAMPNNTAQIFSFTVTTDEGETFGPFDLADPDQIYCFPVGFTAGTLRFDAVETDTGRTGAVEIEVFGTPQG